VIPSTVASIPVELGAERGDRVGRYLQIGDQAGKCTRPILRT
jgi:hypothetical protein